MELKLDISLIKGWKGYKGRPFLISGPCSAETEEQVIETARQLVQVKQVSIFRAGIWKPRTRPDSFEGVGIDGSWFIDINHFLVMGLYKIYSQTYINF